MSGTDLTPKGLIGWFATNHVAANLLMLFVIGMGIWAAIMVKKETMPEFRFDVITVNVPYLGGAPEEVDESVVVKIEEAVKNIQGIKEVRSLTNLGLKDAKDLVDGAPNTVKEAASKDEAEQIKAKLEEQGAQVTLK